VGMAVEVMGLVAVAEAAMGLGELAEAAMGPGGEAWAATVPQPGTAPRSPGSQNQACKRRTQLPTSQIHRPRRFRCYRESASRTRRRCRGRCKCTQMLLRGVGWGLEEEERVRRVATVGCLLR